MPSLHRLVFVLGFLVTAAGTAAAQPAAPPPPYASPMRAQCADELEKDAGWRADITGRFEVLAHEKAAAKIQRNERHVFIAYGVIWVLVAGFVGVMWFRQGKLKDEIKRLEEELKRAEDDDKKDKK